MTCPSSQREPVAEQQIEPESPETSINALTIGPPFLQLCLLYKSEDNSPTNHQTFSSASAAWDLKAKLWVPFTFTDTDPTARTSEDSSAAGDRMAEPYFPPAVSVLLRQLLREQVCAE